MDGWWQPLGQLTAVLMFHGTEGVAANRSAAAPAKGPASSVKTPALSTGEEMGRPCRRPTCMKI